MYIELDDFRQSYVVAKNEIRKFVVGKRFALYVLLIVLVFALITFMPFLVGGNLGHTAGDVISKYVPYVFLLIILAATLFASVTIVSEFEERTALVLFTRPIKKTSIFLGKIIGCIILEATMIIAFYIGIAVVTFLVAGTVPTSLLTSLGVALLYTVAASGVAIFISSIMKKGSTAAIMTFVFLLLILTIISGVLSTVIDPWFMLDQAEGSIAKCIPEYVANANKGIQNIIDALGMDIAILKGYVVVAADMTKTVITMVGWSVASMLLAWATFIKREF